MNKNRIFTLLDVAIIVIVTSGIMCFLGGILIFRHLGGINYTLLSGDTNLQEFISAYNDLTENYYDDLNKDELIKGAINGMYSKVSDPYTNYLDDVNTTSLNDTLSGKYQGIGVRIESTQEGIVINEVFDDTPASSAGLRKGDLITHINNQSIEGLTASEVVEMIKKVNNSITLTIKRDYQNLTFKLTTKEVMTPVIYSQVLEKNGHKVGYISLSVFNDTADVQFEKAVSKLENSNIESLIIDLRDNSGGYLEVAKNIAEMFIAKDKIIYSLESKNSKTDYRDKTNEKRNYKIAVLINNSSASASEILAASLKYSYGAVLVGETSYGKGKVQERASLSYGNTVKYTSALWLTPAGNCIDGKGLIPDFPVAFDTTNYDKDDIYSDSQILYALNNLAT